MLLSKSKALILLSAMVFTLGIISFTVSNVHSSASLVFDNDNPCYHCGSIEACEEGGQPYGFYDPYNECEIVWKEDGPFCEYEPGYECGDMVPGD